MSWKASGYRSRDSRLEDSRNSPDFRSIFNERTRRAILKRTISVWIIKFWHTWPQMNRQKKNLSSQRITKTNLIKRMSFPKLIPFSRLLKTPHKDFLLKVVTRSKREWNLWALCATTTNKKLKKLLKWTVLKCQDSTRVVNLTAWTFLIEKVPPNNSKQSRHKY